jgi:putative NIF3 family GTP cyclohydrolase 1 type 2
MEALAVINVRIDEFFGIAESGVDPAFSRYLPAVYDAERTPWRTWVEPDFAERFNGLMLRGGDTVHTVFLAAFPSDLILHDFLTQAQPGDLLFLHHPIDLESGDPRGGWGRFFRPIPTKTVHALQSKRLSVYSCHAPLDYHPTLSTSRSIATALEGTIMGQFFPYGPGYAGVIATLPPISFVDLEHTLRRVFAVPYLDTAGARPAVIETVAIVAGSGGRVEQMRDAEAAGAQAYITGRDTFSN